MEALFVLFVVFFFFPFLGWLSDQSEEAKRQKRREQQKRDSRSFRRDIESSKTKPPAPLSQPTGYKAPRPTPTPKTYQGNAALKPGVRHGPPTSNQEGVLRRPVGDCICGCNGVPMTHLAPYSIDYEAYKRCPARRRRKSTGSFINDRGVREQWKPAPRKSYSTKAKPKPYVPRGPSRTEIREEARKKKREEAARAEALRIADQQPALGAAEAERRGLPTYIGKDCAMKHGGLRHTRNGECVECKKADSRLRDAMRRGAYPRDLSFSEKRRIEEIYAECRRRTRETGIEHHVDHIKPLAAGGEHHPDNLQILTAAENLSKGAKWDE